MKFLMVIFLLAISYRVCAQKPLFIRVYDLTGKKIDKGQLLTFTDTSIQLKKHETQKEIPLRNIGSIKTKRSGGSNVFTGSAIGLLTIGIAGAASSKSQAGAISIGSGSGAAAGALLGIPIGALFGGISILFKNSSYYPINGEEAKLKAFRETIQQQKNILLDLH